MAALWGWFDPMLLNRERARAIMERENLDALVAMRPHHVYYFSDHWCGMMDARWEAIYFAVLPRDEQAPATLVMPSLGTLNLVDRPTWMPNVIAVTMPWAAAAQSDASPAAFPLPPLPSGPAQPTDNDKAKSDLIDSMQGHSAPTAPWALKAALEAAGAAGGRVGFDDYRVAAWGEAVGVAARFVPAGHLFQEIRLIKTDAEIALMRQAAILNEQACRTAASAIAEGVRPAEIETIYMTEMARGGGQGVFLSVALGKMPYDRFTRGIPVMVDAFGRLEQYHGDVGRTVVIGDPPEGVMRRTEALAAAWDAVFGTIRPGLRYGDIRTTVTRVVRDHGLPELVFCNPHNVGLTHTDDPAPDGAPPGVKGDIVLEEGMIINVDLPYEEYGWGSIHTEDTVLVTKDGCEALTSNDTKLIVVE
jgi:Xaa-Pro aminopeptidase